MHHILGNKVLEYDVNDKGVIVDEREIDRTINLNPNIPDISIWIKEHMVFWYDMSKPVDVYTPGVTYVNQFINEGGALKYDKAINKCTITHTPTTNNKNFWQIPCASSSTINSYKIRVTGLPKGFIIQSGFYSNKITSDGEYDIASYTNTATSIKYVGFYLAGDNVNDMDCNIIVEEIPTRQSVPTNEMLKANPYLQDFSGNNRPLKLNNFLFAAMSGVGGYEINWTDTTIWANFLGSRFEGKIESSKLTITSALVSSGVIETKVPSFSIGYKVRVTGITDESLVYGYTNEAGQSLAISITEDGEYELPSNNVVEATYNMRWRVVAASYPHTCNITIEQIPAYPNALVTDGVDDYGQVQNLQQGVKMLFMTANIFKIDRFIYDQRFDAAEPFLFAINNANNTIAYNHRNSGGVTYIDGTLNESTVCQDLLNKRHIMTIVNNNVTSERTKTPFYFRNMAGNSWANLAFYNSIGFDSVPTKETDGFTEQELIDYVLENLITQ